MQKLQTVLFDMGNVLVYFSHDRMCAQIGELCSVSAAEIRQQVFDSEVQWQFERGHISEEQFRQFLEEKFQIPVELNALKRATADIFELNHEIVPVLTGLKQLGLRLVLLSNTCITHYEWVRDNYPVLQHFDDLVLSYEVGAIKPEPAIFTAALGKIQCDPAACLYTDDIAQYVDYAKTIGLNAEVFSSTSQLKRHLFNHGIDL